MKDSEGVMVNRHARNALGQHILIKVRKEKKRKKHQCSLKHSKNLKGGRHLLLGGHRYGNLFCRLLQSRIC